MCRRRTARLSFEQLENRSLLAGNVTASLSGADLMIAGDANGNTITVESMGVDTVQVHGFDTTVNGGTAIKSFHVTGNISISLNGGDDTLRVTNLLIHDNLAIDMGSGANVVLLGQSVAGDNVQFGATPSGPLFVQNDLSVASAGGADRMFQSNVHVQETGTFSLGDGADNIQFARPTGSGANVEYSGLLRIWPGYGNDTVDLQGLVVDDDMVITDAQGTGSININNMDVHGSLTITTGNSADSIGVQNTNVHNTFLVVSQGGNDTVNISAIASTLTINSGTGDDGVHVSSANVNALNAFMGPGNDQLDLLSDTTNQINGFGNDNNDLFLVRNTRAVDAFFYGEAGDDTYEDSLALPNNISHLHLFTIEHQQHV
jgi:hypothetical protein